MERKTLKILLVTSALLSYGLASFAAEQSTMHDEQQPRQTQQQQQPQQQVIASPNPSVKEVETTGDDESPRVTSTQVRASVTAKSKPMKATAHGGAKSKRRRARPRL